ncbi:MAG: hypothetical protein ACMUJM_02220 [bacterium]
MRNKFVTITAILLIMGVKLTIYTHAFEADTGEGKPDEAENLLWIDHTHYYLSQKVCHIALWFDRFFGDECEVDESAKSIVKLTNAVGQSKNKKINYRSQFRAHFFLPNVNRRLRLMLVGERGKDAFEKTETSNKSSELALLEEDDTEEVGLYSAALQWIIQKSDNSNIDFNVSARFKEHIYPYAKGRYQRMIELSPRLLFRFSETLFWYEEEGFGGTTVLDFDQIMNYLTFFRLSSEATLLRADQGFDWIERIEIYHQLSSHKAISAGVGIRNKTTPIIKREDLWIEMRFCQNIYQTWLFLEIIPSINWPRNENGKAIPGIIVKLEMLFGK